MSNRLGLVLFVLDNFISIIDDHPPHVSCNEMNINWPDPEGLFIAANEAEWFEKRQSTTKVSRPLPVSVTISMLLCNPTSCRNSPLPNTLMGRFALLHCPFPPHTLTTLTSFSWLTKEIYRRGASFVAHQAYIARKPSIRHPTSCQHLPLPPRRDDPCGPTKMPRRLASLLDGLRPFPTQSVPLPRQSRRHLVPRWHFDAA